MKLVFLELFLLAGWAVVPLVALWNLWLYRLVPGGNTIRVDEVAMRGVYWLTIGVAVTSWGGLIMGEPDRGLWWAAAIFFTAISAVIIGVWCCERLNGKSNGVFQC